MASTEYAELWDTPDAKRERAPGKWDVYCAQCGRFVCSVASPVEPHSVRCRRCRDQAMPDTQTCCWCGYLALGHWRDGQMFVCSHCWERRQAGDLRTEDAEDAARHV